MLAGAAQAVRVSRGLTFTELKSGAFMPAVTLPLALAVSGPQTAWCLETELLVGGLEPDRALTFLAVWPWSSRLASLNLNVLICLGRATGHTFPASGEASMRRYMGQTLAQSRTNPKDSALPSRQSPVSTMMLSLEAGDFVQSGFG